MKHKIGYWGWVWRELVCFILGHNWVSSWGRRTDYNTLAEMEYTDIPYAQRKTGNAYYAFRAWWRHKCTRCRLKTRDDSWSPWHTQMRLGVSAGCNQFVFHMDWMLNEQEGPEWKKRVAALPAAILGATGYFFLYWERGPSFLYGLPLDLKYKLYEWVEGKE